MRVITLDNQKFRQQCRLLHEKVSASGFQPDGVIAIATGGVFVATEMGYTDFHVVTLQRAGTAVKRRHMDTLLRHLPYFLTNILRIMESMWLRHRRCRVYSNAIQQPMPLPETLDIFLSTRPARILIVDDAVDSGSTLQGTYDAIRSHLPDADIRSAVLTVTQPSPAIQPDYTLHSDGTLIRFPWSGDFRK